MAVEKLIVDHIDTWTTALQTRSTAGRGSSGKIDLYGIKKLRELILELAVRGKLVPQDPNDEPASVLLKRIAVEKAELVKQGKIKKQKPLPEISEEDKPFELPAGWEWVRLGEAFYIEMGQSPSSQYYNQSEEGIPFFQGKADFGKKYPTARYWCTSPTKLAQKNDVLLSVRAPVGPTNLSPYHCCIGRGLAAIRCLSDAPHEYLLYILKASQRRLEELATGTTFVAVSKTDIEPLLMPIPPLNEQIRIVDTIDRLMSLCDQLEQHSLTSLDAHQQLVEILLTTLTDSQNADELAKNWARISEHFDTLFTTEASIDALKQTILQLAVMGKLVPQDPNDEPASELLKRIAQEKAQLVKDGKIKKQKPLPPISDEEKPFELPDGWEWCCIDDLTFVSGGIQKQPKRRPIKNHFPYLRVANVQRGNINIDELERFELEPHELTFWSLKKNDILIVEGNGSADEIGRCAIWLAPIEKCVYQNHLIRVRGIMDGHQEFIALYLNSPSGIKEMQRLAVTTSGLYNLSVGKIRGITIPLPPLNQQNLILSKIREYIFICENLKISLQSAQQTQLHLADALTDAAIN
ncbi:type I restriction-modification system, specificity subunit S [Citrobacter freundii ATCC 8090 = MTCC 1658 = NBRC 12681]|uniref:restriction endonuclease subunit S n=1 Tax=Citrobacter freundii TaxID=546 RepID=UPI00001728E2|nr:restriction endonuclease subunit S [Citrobacter freundii]EKS57552.1 Type I restriction enzyme EcoAI specificity protein (S protein, S.EcoAI) [Citrobacter freundii ATCC 8090 = MTCC 1658 = NBRC 12681]EXF30742.1 type I restriction endonuclease EcoAI subunit S [Citrobacter freundii RLS1]KFB97816.1 type I restriction-modification system, specificity subunit S [Citrobacter freundii ATCC 8090 = MTCC 1658 = NBRC 12681]MBJ8943881.1 restriction endonuclease subunit S [Citrobacter freundii]MBJ9181818.